VRAAAYLIGPALLTRRRTRAVALAGAAAYLSLPLRRAVAGPRPVPSALLVPAMAAVRDIAKAAGCLSGMATARE
jgi:hypothetical protein